MNLLFVGQHQLLPSPQDRSKNNGRISRYAVVSGTTVNRGLPPTSNGEGVTFNRPVKLLLADSTAIPGGLVKCWVCFEVLRTESDCLTWRMRKLGGNGEILR